ncbi:TolC family protein [Lewinella sp. IMCC34183]|uniref:TolC family protein n=1 Tax=Lewinella sp. IMCC34183 TaxID=2248762 RepID=UPI0018E552C6|nr:TolC family protein [Lewinella sp. IMCC34183]
MKYLIPLLLVLPLSAGLAAQSGALDLQQAIALTLEHHPLLQQNRAETEAAIAATGAARAAKYPQATGMASYSHLAPTGYVEFPTGGEMIRSSFLAPDTYNAAVDVSYTLFDFGRAQTGIDLAENRKALSETSGEVQRQSLALQTIQYFYQAHFLQEAIAVQDRQLGALRLNLEQTEKLRDNGEATAYEVLSTEVRISAAENQRSDLETQLRAAYIELERLTGQPDLDRTALVHEWVDTTRREQLPVAQGDRPELQLARLRERGAALQEVLAGEAFKPTVVADVQAGLKNQILPDTRAILPNYVAGARLTVPIFTGYRNRYALAEARASREAAGYARANTEATIGSEVRQATDRLNTAYDKIERSRLQVRQASEAAELARLKYANGVITNLDLLASEVAVSEAEINQLRTIFDYTLDTYLLKQALGLPLY